MLLLFLDEEEAFWTFVVLITEILPPNVYDVTMEGANIDQNVLMNLISERYPQIWNKISGGKSFWECEQDNTGMPTCSLVTSHWFLTLFINILPVEVSLILSYMHIHVYIDNGKIERFTCMGLLILVKTKEKKALLIHLVYTNFIISSDGQKVLFRIALGIFKLNESEILAVNDPLEVFQIVQVLRRKKKKIQKKLSELYI